MALDIEAVLGMNRGFRPVKIKGRTVGVSWGIRRETAVWIATKPRRRFMWRGHDALFIAAGRFRLRLMKPGWLMCNS